MKFLLFFLLSSRPATTPVTSESFLDAVRSALEAQRKDPNETPRICIGRLCLSCHATSKDGKEANGVACDLKVEDGKHCIGWCTDDGCEGGCHSH